ncbi:MAG: biotin--[acetyl-CoA-carboxylase] ligase [Clostridia bacterium]|nr:biotin--[acetyl-CoA-carboxylase] ligase [Clostridia bacterium]
MNLSTEAIRKLTGLGDVTVLDETDSTNTRLKAMASEKAEGAVLVARKQTAGRGRGGKTFFSPAGGLYLSVLVKPRDPAVFTRLTMMAGVAAAEAIEVIAGKQAKIKWVNDIFVDGKKVCGILAESDARGTAAVVGAGFNLLPPAGGFDKTIAEIAGAVLEREPADASRLAAEFLNRLFVFLRGERPFFDEYRRRSLLIGHTVRFARNGQTVTGHAADIRADGALLVRAGEQTIALFGGEVSLCDYPRG